MKHYNIPHSGMAWYGIKREGCPETISRQLESEMKIAHASGGFSERECEVDCFLYVLDSIKGKVTMLDLGAGWGEWSMALAGIRDEYESIVVECDPKFYKIAVENFQRYKIKGKVILGAISERCRMVRVNTGWISDKYCGSSISFGGYFSGSRILALMSGIYHRLKGNTVAVQGYTIDSIAPTHVDLVVMDVQGAELLVLQGCKKTKVDWWLIGTHGRNVHDKVKSVLAKTHDLIVDAPPGKTTDLGGYKVICQKGQDGIQLWRVR